MPLQGGLNIERMCQLAQVSRAGFYRWLPEPPLVEEEMEVRSVIQQIALEHRRRYGYRRISAERRRRGMVVNHKRVARIMREDNVLAVQPRQFVVTTKSDHKLEVYLNLARRLKLTGMDQLWVADITYIRLKAEFVYLAVILDGFSRNAVGWSLERTLATRLALAAFGTSHRHAKAGVRPSSSFRSWRAICQRGVCRRSRKARDDHEHESSGKSLRQCQLRKLPKNFETGGNLRQSVPRPRSLAHQHRRIHPTVLQSTAIAFRARLPFSGNGRRSMRMP